MGYVPDSLPIFCISSLSGSGSVMPSFSAAASDSLASSTIFRILSSMQFAPWLVSSIVRFWGIIAGRVGRVLLRELRFVLLGLGMVREFGGLTGCWGEPLERDSSGFDASVRLRGFGQAGFRLLCRIGATIAWVNLRTILHWSAH